MMNTNNASIKTLPLASQSKRRAIVLTCYLGAIIAAIGMVLAENSTWMQALIIAPFTVASVIAMGLLLQPHRLGISDGPDETLDERQRQARNKTYLAAFRILGSCVMFGALYWYTASETNLNLWLPSTSLERNIVFCVITILAITLPTAMTAWNEPDAIAD